MMATSDRVRKASGACSFEKQSNKIKKINVGVRLGDMNFNAFEADEVPPKPKRMR